MSYRLGVDVGGTFTDVLLVDEQAGSTWRAKTSSTPGDQSAGVLHGINQVCEQAGVDRSAIAHLLHGTTVATNAILEGKGARVGLVTTEGFRQVLQIARSFVPGGPGRLDHLAQARAAGRPGEHRRGARADRQRRVRGPRARRGRGPRPAAPAARSRDRGAGDLADQRLRRRCARAADRANWPPRILPGVPVSLSSVVLPEMREYERTLTTVANGYVQPQVARYVRQPRRPARGESGVQAPRWPSCAATAASPWPSAAIGAPVDDAAVRPRRRRDRRGLGGRAVPATATC